MRVAYRAALKPLIDLLLRVSDGAADLEIGQRIHLGATTHAMQERQPNAQALGDLLLSQKLWNVLTHPYPLETPARRALWEM